MNVSLEPAQNTIVEGPSAPQAAFIATARAVGERARQAFRQIRRSPASVRNAALVEMARLLRDPQNQARVLSANEQDLTAGTDLSASLRDRLRLNPERIEAIARALDEIIQFPDPVGEIISGQRLVSGVEMIKKRVPLGVVFTVFESRPNVTVDIGALCLKSGNAAILRGGKEALETNRALHALFVRALGQAGLPDDAVQFVDNPDRALMTALLAQDTLIDLVVPRGGEGLIQAVTANSRIPVVKHDKGVCNLYIDSTADAAMALAIAVNAKLSRPSVCNSIENLIIHRAYAGAAELLEGLRVAGVELYGCDRTRALDPAVAPIDDPDAVYAEEFLDARLSVKVVDDLEEAVDFIYRYGSSHSEAIVARDQETIDAFVERVDSAAVFINCSTRFHDGGQMGMGAEVGISTGRLHVRGPMGLRDLTTTTYVMHGRGQVRR